MTQGFTLVELLLVMALMLVVGVYMFPLGISFYRSQMTNEAVEGIQSALLRAQTYAITHKNDSSFGVRFHEDSYVLFQGDSYTERVVVQDEIYQVGAHIAGDIIEVVFEPLTGLPSTQGTLVVTSGDREAQVEINIAGRIQ